MRFRHPRMELIWECAGCFKTERTSCDSFDLSRSDVGLAQAQAPGGWGRFSLRFGVSDEMFGHFKRNDAHAHLSICEECRLVIEHSVGAAALAVIGLAGLPAYIRRKREDFDFEDARKFSALCAELGTEGVA